MAYPYRISPMVYPWYNYSVNHGRGSPHPTVVPIRVRALEASEPPMEVARLTEDSAFPVSSRTTT